MYENMSDRDEALRMAREAEIAVGITGGNPSPEKVERFYQLCRDKFVGKGGVQVECWGCEGKPAKGNDPCDVCGRSSKDIALHSPASVMPAPTEGATPETDANLFEYKSPHDKDWYADEIVGVDFARLLERQRNELRERVKELEAWLDHIAAPNDPNRTELLAKKGTKP